MDTPPAQCPRETEQPADTMEALREQVGQLQQAVRAHAPVDQAIGALIAIGRMSPEEGWDVLREVSMNTNIKLRDVAHLVIEGARTGRFDNRLRGALSDRLHTFGHPSE
ncbi:ANTAR domain-containing protein [Streptomyces montanisoli]|uniref:ANTAR domain-containing protein n=1 Tax=Streptomyces montanisoli TaxID=2798581 RepID=A0A940MC67_9ACTN|nr:ANTAR domain-containing protein [Streptomyces montanisoli]MBP0456033.1 ANTAR domain-containing protein [Streptomyces montanisoli]